VTTNELLRAHVTRVGFNLTLTKNQIAELDQIPDLPGTQSPEAVEPARRTQGREPSVTGDLTLFDLPAAPRRAKTPGRRPKVPAAARPNTPAAVTATGQTWTLTFPAPDRMLSVNSGNQHWRRTSPIHKTWREATYLHAKAAKLPTGLTRVRLDFTLRFPRAGRIDVGNYYTHVVKPCVDGIGPPIDKMRAGKRVIAVGYGLIPDDTAEYLDGPHVVLGEPVRDKTMPYGQVILTITNLGGDDLDA
jgi:hypothetical protein